MKEYAVLVRWIARDGSKSDISEHNRYETRDEARIAMRWLNRGIGSVTGPAMETWVKKVKQRSK